MSMVVYVVVKIRSPIDGISLMGAGDFYKELWSTYVLSLVTSAYQGRCIVTLLQPFVKRFSS